MEQYKTDVEAIDAFGEKVKTLRTEIAKVIVGQDEVVENVIISIFSHGHVLLIGVPGLAKTLLVNTISRVLGLSYSRIQFTPDLMPSDIIGTEILDQSRSFKFNKGPVFANIILADEINRAPSKVQSALLEAMQERQVTIGDTTFKLADPFLVMATQNPIEQEGTYPLPEAQVDRFMLKLLIDYPSKAEEKQIMQRVGFDTPAQVEAVLTPAQLDEIHCLINQVYMDDKLRDYIVELVFATRDPGAAGIELAPYIQYGASPRATIYLSLAARAYAFLHGRAFVTPQDVKTIAPAVLRHRIIPSYEAEAEDITTDQIIGRIFDAVPVP